MYKYLPITDVYAREILDSRGNPTIEVEVLAGDEFFGRASVPSGASTGKYEAVELRDKEKRYRGLGVCQAADHVNARIAPEVIGMNALDQAAVDQAMIRLEPGISRIWGRMRCWECHLPRQGQQRQHLGFRCILLWVERMSKSFRFR